MIQPTGAAQTGTPTAAQRVLLVEDMPGDARLVDMALREAASAHPGRSFLLDHQESLGAMKAALAAVAAGTTPPYDIMLLDLSLPDSFGLATVRGALEALATHRQAHVPVVVLTGLDDPRTGLAAIHEGAQDYIIKGEFNPHLFERVIAYAIERKAAAQRHARLLARHAMVLNSLGEGVVEVDRNGVVRHINPAAADLLGCAANTVAGRRFADLLAPSADPQAVRALDQTLTEGGRRELFGVTLHGPCGSAQTVEVDLVVTPLREDDAISGAVIVLRDLGGRNAAYRTLADHLAHEGQVMDMLREAVVTVDPQGVIIGFNAAFRALAAGEEHEILGAALTDVLISPLAESSFLDVTHMTGAPNANMADGQAEFLTVDGALTASRRGWTGSDGAMGGIIFTFSRA